mmetsp:Transcript_1979/g.5230  ORF Transcript_1979/g.5230 Transcript_1979/m.5230 type:complete len:207 (-) Transcript_1979:414-1034(-)
MTSSDILSQQVWPGHHPVLSKPRHQGQGEHKAEAAAGPAAEALPVPQLHQEHLSQDFDVRVTVRLLGENFLPENRGVLVPQRSDSDAWGQEGSVHPSDIESRNGHEEARADQGRQHRECDVGALEEHGVDVGQCDLPSIEADVRRSQTDVREGEFHYGNNSQANEQRCEIHQRGSRHLPQKEEDKYANGNAQEEGGHQRPPEHAPQ